MASRTWGTGGIQWRPGNIQACINVPRYQLVDEVLTPRKQVPISRVHLKRTAVDEEGRLTKQELDVDLEEERGEKMTVLQLKEEICTMLDDVEPARLRLTRNGRELQDALTLRAADVMNDAELQMRVLRRSAVAAAPSAAPEAPAEASAAAALTALRIKTLAGRSAILTGLSEDMDVRQVRALVAQHPLMREEAEDGKKAAADDGKKGDKKGAAAPPPEEEPPDGAGLLLFGVGIDLDLGEDAGRAETGEGGAQGGELPGIYPGTAEEPTEGGAEGDAEDLTAPAAADLTTGDGGEEGPPSRVVVGEETPARASGGLTAQLANNGAGEVGDPQFAVPRPQFAVPPTTPRGTHLLVHLRDGRELREYGLQHESVVYVCKDTK